jgi:hypothetical protein
LAETLTESFCERCGTRYEFNAPTRLNPLRKTRGLVGGLRNYLTGQDALSDAIGDAMRSEEDGLATAQLDAFHESFNFCIDCRQYTCVNCWNDDAGRCRSCAPIPGTDDLAERLAASMAAPSGPPPVFMGDELQRHLGLDAWPTSDLPVGGDSNGHGPASWPEAEFPVEPVYAEVAPEPEPVVAEVAPEPEPEPVVAEPEPEPVVAEVVAKPEPEQVTVPWSYEPELVAADIAPEPAFEAPEAEPVTAVEPVPVDDEPEPELVAAEIDIEPVRVPLRVVAWDEDAAFELVEADASPFLEAEVEPGPVAAEVEPVAEPVAAEVTPEPEPEPVAAEVEPVAAEVAPEPEPEPVAAEVAPEPEPEPVAAEVEPVAEPVAAEVAPEPEPEPVAAEVEPVAEPVAAEVAPEPEPEPVAAEVAPEPEFEPPIRLAPISETILHFPTRPAAPRPADDERAAAAATADGPEVAARRAQLDSLGLGDPGEGPVAPDRPQPLPYRSRGAGVTQADLARAAALRGSFWEASAREVASAGAQVGVQACGQCGLSLSANARFCRRCGTRQAQSA